MRASKFASRLHRWIGLLIGAQVILWFASGWFLSFFPIEKVRGEDQMRAPVAQPVRAADIAAPLSRFLSGDQRDLVRLEVHSLDGRPVVLLERATGRPALHELATGQRISPISAPTAVRLARADYIGAGQPISSTFVVKESTEYRGPLPAWRVRFDDARNTALYVAADTAQVTARRTDLWRVFDFLWGLHIMDWKDHQNINYPWLWATAAAALALALTGAFLIPSRFGWRRRQGKINK